MKLYGLNSKSSKQANKTCSDRVFPLHEKFTKHYYYRKFKNESNFSLVMSETKINALSLSPVTRTPLNSLRLPLCAAKFVFLKICKTKPDFSLLKFLSLVQYLL